MVIIIFFCRMHCFLFKSYNNYLIRISGKRQKKHLKTFLSFHYKLCESVEELKTFLRPMFVLISTIFRPVIVYFFYCTFKNREETSYIMILSDFIIFIYFLFVIVLTSMIANIDVETKKRLNTVYECALKLSNNQDIFAVSVFLFKIFTSYF